MKEVVILNGSGGVGKDTFCKLVNKYALVTHCSSVDEVKYFARTMGWNGTKTEKDRKFLSDLKALLTRYNDRPFNYLSMIVKKFLSNKVEEILFIDIREPAEIDRAKRAFNAKTLLITNKNVPVITSNSSDACVLNYFYDFVIHNDGDISTFDLAAKNFVEELRSHEECRSAN